MVYLVVFRTSVNACPIKNNAKLPRNSKQNFKSLASLISQLRGDIRFITFILFVATKKRESESTIVEYYFPRMWNNFSHYCFPFIHEACKTCIVSFISQMEKRLHIPTVAGDLYFVLLCSNTSALFTKAVCLLICMDGAQQFHCAVYRWRQNWSQQWKPALAFKWHFTLHIFGLLGFPAFI